MERKACQAEGTAYAKAVSQQEQVREGQLDEIREGPSHPGGLWLFLCGRWDTGGSWSDITCSALEGGQPSDQGDSSLWWDCGSREMGLQGLSLESGPLRTPTVQRPSDPHPALCAHCHLLLPALTTAHLSCPQFGGQSSKALQGACLSTWTVALLDKTQTENKDSLHQCLS